MTDIEIRLRAWHTPGETITGDVGLYLEAADEIERLREREAELQAQWGFSESISALEIERLREQLEKNSKFIVEAKEFMREQIELVRDLNRENEQLNDQLAEATAEIEKLRDLWENSPMAAR